MGGRMFMDSVAGSPWCAQPGWAGRLTPDEARLAALYSMIELNGFASFLPDLAEAHPDDVEDVIGEELSAELQQGTVCILLR